MWDRLKLITPAGAAVSLTDAKQQLRVENSDEDAFINNLIAAATGMIEGAKGAGLCVMTQSWELSLDCFPVSPRTSIEIPLGPVASVTKIEYVDGAGATQTWTAPNYLVDVGREPARITPAFGIAWPVARIQNGAVKVTFVAGEATANPVLRAAILLLVSHLFENREASVIGSTVAELPLGVCSILNQFARGRVA